MALGMNIKMLLMYVVNGCDTSISFDDLHEKLINFFVTR